MKKLLPLLSLAAVALAAAPPAAALVDLDLVVQMPLAVVEVEDAGYPRDDLGLLASGLAASELGAADVIDVLRWAPVVWYLDELADGDLFLDADVVRLDAEPRRLRLIEDRDGRWLITSREDLVLLDLADREIDRQWVIDRDVVVRDGRDGRDADRDGRRFDRDQRGMGAYVQWLHGQGLRGRALSDAIHAELRRRGVPAGPKDRFDGPPPVSRRFVADRLPDVLVVDGRLVDLRDGAGERLVLPPGQARKLLASAPPFDGARDRAGRLARGDGNGRSSGPPADRGNARGRDDRGGGPPPHAAANRGGGEAKARGGGQGRGKAEDAGPDRGQGQGKAKAQGGGGNGQGQGKAKAAGGGGQGRGKAKAGGGGGGQGGGKGKGGGGNGGGGKKGGGGR